MPNPYPATFQDEPGRARLEGEIVFTDPANQPGGAPLPAGYARTGTLLLIPVGTNPVGVAFSPVLDLAYVANVNDNTVTPIVPSTGIPGAPIAVGNNPQPVAFSPVLDLAYVANTSDNTVTPIVPSTGIPGAPIAVGTNPTGVAFSPVLDLAYVANYGAATVSQIVSVPWY